MNLRPSSLEQSARLRSDLKLGLPVIIQHKEDTQLVYAVESLKDGTLAKIKRIDNKFTNLAITARRAATLNTVPYDKDLARIIVPKNYTLEWLRSTADPALDLKYPMKGPFFSIRQGQSEIARAAIELCKKSQLLPAALTIGISKSDSIVFQAQNILIQDSTSILGQSAHEAILSEVSEAELPLKGMSKTQIHVFRDKAGLAEHYALEFGDPSRREPVLVRLHSSCFTGDVLGSLKCDCGPQLKTALKKISTSGSGLLIYLNQEGRGIGLANKMRAYQLQDQGFDTVEANHRLGFEDEERDLRIGAQIILKLGFKKLRLMTNNPKKVASVSEMGLEVIQRVELLTQPTDENAPYLSTKASKSGHLL